MVRERIPMYNVLEVLRQRYQEKVSSVRKIAQSVNISRPTVQKYLDLAAAIGIGYWPLREETGDLSRLRSALFPDKKASASPGTPLPDWQEVEKELKQRKKSGVTRRLLWEEYRESVPEGLSYSQYCALYSKHLKNGDLRLHVPHAPGEELYVDYSGPKIRIEPPGQPPYFASLFVAVMGRSSYAFACVTPDMKTPSWIDAHRKTFEYLGGVPCSVIPDRTRTAVVSTHRIEPQLNRAFREMAAHYGFEVSPARAYSPRDKGAVENGVLNAQRALMAPLRHRKFVSIGELNAALLEQLEIFNRKPFQGRSDSRTTVFVEEDRPALGPLPQTPFETENWTAGVVHIDYHVAVNRFYYSVPYGLVGQTVDVRLAAKTVEIFFREERVASHLRSFNPRHRFSTLGAHMPPHHKGYLDQSREMFMEKAGRIGPAVVSLFKEMFRRRNYPPLAYRSCQGVLGLRKAYPDDRLNAACERAVRMQSFSYQTVEGILKHGTEKCVPLESLSEKSPPHENVRGKEYYVPTSGDTVPEPVPDVG